MRHNAELKGRLGDKMDIVICPGCGEIVQHDNNGCPHCGYENGWNSADGRLMTLRELLAAPSYPERGALEMNQVCPAFLRRIVEVVDMTPNANVTGGEAVPVESTVIRGD